MSEIAFSGLFRRGCVGFMRDLSQSFQRYSPIGLRRRVARLPYERLAPAMRLVSENTDEERWPFF